MCCRNFVSTVASVGSGLRALVRPCVLSASCPYCLKKPSRRAKHRCPVLTHILVDERQSGSGTSHEKGDQLLHEHVSEASDRRQTGGSDSHGCQGAAKKRNFWRLFDHGGRNQQTSQDRATQLRADEGPDRNPISSVHGSTSGLAVPSAEIRLLRCRAGQERKERTRPRKGSERGQQRSLPSSSPGVPQDGLLSAMGRLCLRGCDSSSASQPGLHMVSSHHRTESIVQSLAQVSRAWNQEKETAPPKYPLRIMLLSALLEVTIERAEAAVKPDRKDATVEAGLILDREEEPFWPFLRWNPDKREEEILSGEEMRPLEHSRLIRKLNHIRDTIHPENVLRCHGHHQITEQMQAETYRLVLEVETVGEEAQNLHEWLRLLVNCSVWKLIGGRFRRERLGRSPLANRLSELLGL